MTRHYNSNSKKQAKKKANFHEKESNVDVNKASNSNMMEIDANATNALQTFATSTNASIINTKEPISPHSIEDSSNTFNDNGNSGSNVEDNKMTQDKNNINKKKFVEKFLINYKGFVGLYITRFGKQRKFVANFDNEEDLNNLVVTDLPDYEGIRFSKELAPVGNINKENSIRVKNIPLNTSSTLVHATFEKYGKIIKFSMQTKDLWQEAIIYFEKKEDILPFHNETWAVFILKDMVRVEPLSMNEKQYEKRHLHALKLGHLPFGTTARDLVEIINATKAKAIFIPKTRKSYVNCRYGWFFFDSDEAAHDAQINWYTLNNTELFWASEDTALCRKCGHPDHTITELSFADIVKNSIRTSLDDSIHAEKIGNKTEDVLKKLMEKVEDISTKLNHLTQNIQEINIRIKVLEDKDSTKPKQGNTDPYITVCTPILKKPTYKPGISNSHKRSRESFTSSSEESQASTTKINKNTDESQLIVKQQEELNKNAKNLSQDMADIKNMIGNISSKFINKSNNDEDDVIKTLCKDNQMDIIGISETKLNRNNSKHCMRKCNTFQSFWSSHPDQPNSAGVGLLISKSLARHIVKIEKYQGRIIYADLYFKGKKKLRIIQVYINSNTNKKQERITTSKQVIKYCQEALNKNFFTIVMGDFNADPEILHNLQINNHTIPYIYNLISTLQTLNFIDSLKITNPNSPQYTWSNNNSKSRIDQIWISHNFAHDLARTKTVDYTSIFSTDHKLIWCDLITSNFYKHQRHWDYNQCINNFQPTCSWLNRSWTILQQIIIQTADKEIPFDKISRKDSNKRSKDTLILHKSLNHLNITKITQNLEIPLENLPDTLYDNVYEQTYKYLISIFNTIKSQKKIEDKIEIEKQIKFFTKKRCEYYTSNQKVMINSILEREKQSIRINRCVINKDGEDEILLLPDDVKKATKNHFSSISNNNHTTPNTLPSPC
ncbi:9339_t:CDS:2 [Entrophospora sp. SA101]|nr:9339_t:CDS:2 [Entrophospora sp. SA101]